MGNITNEQQNGFNGNGYVEKQLAFSNGLNMSNRDPIDLQFKDITYTVNLGFNKGKANNKSFFLLSISSIFLSMQFFNLKIKDFNSRCKLTNKHELFLC